MSLFFSSLVLLIFYYSLMLYAASSSASFPGDWYESDFRIMILFGVLNLVYSIISGSNIESRSLKLSILISLFL